jgi:hypothetical protein
VYLANAFRVAATTTMALLLSFPVFATGTHYTRGYVKKDGTYVKPHRQTNPNKTRRDNWSAEGNTNSSTGKNGTKKPTAAVHQIHR